MAAEAANRTASQAHQALPATAVKNATVTGASVTNKKPSTTQALPVVAAATPTPTVAPALDRGSYELTPIITAPADPQPIAPSIIEPATTLSAASVPAYDTTINNGVAYPPSYPVNVPSHLTLSQAQQYLRQVSPKIAADNAAIVSNERRAAATKDLNKPVVYLATSATHIADDVDTRELKGDLSHVIDNTLNNDLTRLLVALLKPTSPIDVGNLVTEPIPNNIPIDVDKNRVSGNVTVMWSAYNGNKTASLTQLLNSMTEESRADANLSLDEQYTTLTKRYFQTQLAIMAAYLRADALNAIRETDHAAQRALDVGLISKVERLEAKKALADAEYENSKALNDAELAMTALQRLLRTPYYIRPTSPLFVLSKPLPALSYFQEKAKQHHPAFQKIAAKYDQAKALHEFSESAYKPNVTVFGRSEIDRDPSWIAGVSASWKLWGGIDRQASTQSSLAKLHQAEFSQIDVTDNIMLLVEKNWQTLNNARSNFIALNTNIELATEMLRFRRLGFKEGVNTAVDVMQAQAGLEKAKTEQARAANDYVQALADLMQSCGTPLEFNQYMQTADIKLPAIYFEHSNN